MHKTFRTVIVLACFAAIASTFAFIACGKGAEPTTPAAPVTPATPTATAPAEVKVDEYYTCPMHPQIKQQTAGKCSICGMDLVKTKNAPSTK